MNRRLEWWPFRSIRIRFLRRSRSSLYSRSNRRNKERSRRHRRVCRLRFNRHRPLSAPGRRPRCLLKRKADAARLDQSRVHGRRSSQVRRGRAEAMDAEHDPRLAQASSRSAPVSTTQGSPSYGDGCGAESRQTGRGAISTIPCGRRLRTRSTMGYRGNILYGSSRLTS